ncbi:MAG: helix-hairpin-helix domain-containing protein [Ilumatobacteraceae bacterium]
MNAWKQVRQFISEFVNWIGIGRVIATAGGVALVIVGGWWVMRTPPLPIESRIPFAPQTVAIESGSFGSSAFATTSTIPLTIMVHVAGEVVRPGIVVIDRNSRVIDALTAAGGPTSRADLNPVNLAAPLVDAAQIYIPKLGEVPKTKVNRPMPGVNLPPTSSGNSAIGSAVPQPIDINLATEQQLIDLPGVGPATARAIVAYRLLHGPFASVDDLLNVRGIGPAKLEQLLDLVRV